MRTVLIARENGALTAGSQECPGLRGHPQPLPVAGSGTHGLFRPSGHPALRTRPRSRTPLHRPSHTASPPARDLPRSPETYLRRPSRARSRRTGHVSGERSQIPTRPGRAGGSELAGRLPTSRVCAGQDTGAPPFSRAISTVLMGNKYRSRDEQVPFSRAISTVLAERGAGGVAGLTAPVRSWDDVVP